MASPTARRLADLLGLLNASTNIAKSFTSLQSANYQNYIKTSSLVEAIDGVRGNAGAAVRGAVVEAEKATTVTTPENFGTSSAETVAQIVTRPTAIGTSSPSEPSLGSSTPISASSSVPFTPSPSLLSEPILDDQPTYLTSLFITNRNPQQSLRKLKESRIPTSRVSRLWHYGSLVTGLGVGAATESLRRATGFSKNDASILLTDANIDLLVAKLTQMRGAALKFGQLLSIQGVSSGNNPGDGTEIVSPHLENVLLRVHDSANYMPMWQMEVGRQVLTTELGSSWSDLFTSFSPIPMAAASIGQVHAATLRSNGVPVAIKIQYPGVFSSIDADLRNLKMLVTFGRLLPPGMYLDNTIKVMRTELANECDYIREAESMERFGRLLESDRTFRVPKVFKEASTGMVLTSERMEGGVLSGAVEEGQEIGTNLLRLCLRELFKFRFMQTDPNWSNFFYNRKTNQIELIDFGASREFDKRFIDLYLHVLQAATMGDREACWHYSKEMGFVTGYETELMRDAHIDSVMTLGEPFRLDSPPIYDFGMQTVTARVRDTIPVMLRHRLTPPPDETYSLHRKLSGAFLLCSKLGSRIDTKRVFAEETKGYVFDE
ncbi:ABC1 family-domain-containing protein [Endogone sp. FLAS-F59071]|nr:ABC1 family-domain-containing protein [Endogone sp. FLAS-F59071]|eukprot:RUS21946.1 ABC1 family-domain-containing protein [Endogone sp. FLAS-F59071]